MQRLYLEVLKAKQLIKLSNGETKRLLIAAALLKNPVILMLDNPLAGLDMQTRAEFNTIIGDITRSGITVIMATSPSEIPDSIINVAVLKEGNISFIAKNEFDPQSFAESSKNEINKNELSE